MVAMWVLFQKEHFIGPNIRF